MTYLAPSTDRFSLCRKGAGLVLLLSLVLVQSTAFAQPAPAGSDELDISRDIVFFERGDLSLQLDLYRPAVSSEPLPVVLVIREGGWDHGEKESSGPLASALARRGIAAASIEYRGASEAVFPAYVHDTKAAIRWLRDNAQAYDLNPDAIGAIGGSWGGYLAVYAGVTGGMAELEAADMESIDRDAIDTPELASSHLSAVVGISAPLNMADFAARMERFLGVPHASDPGLWELASATTHARMDSPPMLLIASQSDTTVPYQQTLQMAQAYGEAGAEIEVHLMPDVGHAPIWLYNVDLHDRVAAFFHAHLDAD